METKYVIILHNRDDHSFEESPLLDEYPKPELIEYYLSRSNYRYAKVEKRYSLQFQEESYMEATTWKISFINEHGQNSVIYCHSEQELQARKRELDEENIPYQVETL
jgi:superfamily II DNA helicase RecQ